MRALLALTLTLSVATASASFREDALRCIQKSDFDALQALADRPVSVASLDARLKGSAETAESVDWSMLLRKVTTGAVNRVFAQGGEPFLTWIANNPEALGEYVHGGVDGEVNERSFGVWFRIWKECPEAREEGVWRRFAIASALVQSAPVHAMADGKPIDPVARFRFFKQSADDGALVPTFFKSPVWKLRYVAGSWAQDSDLAWVRTAMKPEIRNQFSVGDACMMVPYIETNAKGVSVQTGSKFYDDKPMTLQLMTEYGGVCGAISRFGASSAHSLGVPAFPVAQPAHCAFVWENAESSWKMGNDVHGWGASNQHDGIRMPWSTRPVLIQLYNLARRDEKSFLFASRLGYAASVCTTKIPQLRAAVDACPLFLPAWRHLVSLEPARLHQAGRALGVAPYAVSELYRNTRGDLYLRGIEAIAAADHVPQLGTQTWATLELVSQKIKQTNGIALDPFAVIQCQDKRFKWPGTDATSQAVVAAAIRAAGNRGDIAAQLEKLQR